MSKPKILREDANYSFPSYFELPNDTDEILAEFGYIFIRSRLQLPKTSRQLERLTELHQQLEETIPYVSFNSEAAKREILENFVGWALPKYTFKPLFLDGGAVPTLRLLILVQDIRFPMLVSTVKLLKEKF
jgi:hypothetical protein